MFIIKIDNVDMIAISNIPIPTKTPTAAAHHIVAAVVSPVIWSEFLNITPALKNPIPETIWAITLLWSAWKL